MRLLVIVLHRKVLYISIVRLSINIYCIFSISYLKINFIVKIIKYFTILDTNCKYKFIKFQPFIIQAIELITHIFVFSSYLIFDLESSLFCRRKEGLIFICMISSISWTSSYVCHWALTLAVQYKQLSKVSWVASSQT